LLGLYARRRTGIGQQIFISMLGANGYANYDDFLSYAGKPPRALLDADLYGTSALYRLYRAKDSWVFLALHDDREWTVFCAITGQAALADDPRFSTAEARAANEGPLVQILAALFAERAAADWEQVLIPAGAPCVESIAQSPGMFFRTHEQMRANGFDVRATHAMWGEYQRWGPTVVFSDTPGQYGPGVLAGQNTDAILREFGIPEGDIADLRRQGVVDSAEAMQLVQPITA
jgi:crotonobetainyl-CoA:carnitine CoA-transferase CaiB-like acyl-CoA transferase